MNNFKKKSNILILSFIIFSYTILPSFGSFTSIKIEYTTGQNSLNLILGESENNENLNTFSMKQSAIANKWGDMVLRLDENANGISDQFEKSTNEDISFIIQFPDDYKYSDALKLFKDNGGELKYTYIYAINGFSGSMDYQSFIEFHSQLMKNNIQFFIEGDNFGETHLYFTSRNLRLRPYVWNNLNYTGDNKSSIAIIDTGIDEHHKFFDNSTTGKILAWVDFTENGDNSSAYDDNGHGSHVAGIAAGLGTIGDFNGRAVATNAQNLEYALIDPDEGSYDYAYLGAFNVPSPGQIEIECSFNDTTPLPDYVLSEFYLIRNNIIIAQNSQSTPGDWQKNITYNIGSSSEFGDYYVAAKLTFKDGDLIPDGICTDPNITVRAEVHFPFNPSDHGSGNLWKGVAPNANLVAVKVFDKHGGADTPYSVSLSDAVMGIEWCISYRKMYNISVISMSFGFDKNETSIINAVDNAVEKYGIVAVTSAGNSYAGGNNIGSPADADKAIVVGANNFNDEITFYSSQGGNSSSTNTTKPDITAPGGSFNDVQIFSADTNDNDAEGAQIDNYNDDLYGAQGTSMSCPAVAGAANLLIEAIRETAKWNWDGSNTSKLVKSILLMTATETYPLKREDDVSYSPTLNRGERDSQEGYGRLNIDAAIEAWINNLTGQNLNPTLYSSIENPNAKHAQAGYVNLEAGQTYIFNLTVPSGKDYDIYLYNYTPDEYGQPDLIAKSISPILGQNEQINFTANHDGKYFLVAKAIGLPSADDDDDDDDKKTVTTIDLLTILIIIGIIALLVIVFVIILYKKGRKDDTYDFKPEY